MEFTGNPRWNPIEISDHHNFMYMKARWNDFPFSPSNIPFFYGWIILFASVIGALVSAPGQTMGVSIFTDYLIDSIDISRNQISTAYMFGTIVSSLILTWAGKLYDKYGARWVGMGASLLLSMVLIFLSQSDRIIRYFVNDKESGIYIMTAITVMTGLFFILRFSGQGVITMVSRNMLMKWFIVRRGFVNGIMSVFVALGFSLAPLTFNGLIDMTSWRYAWLLMAGGIFIFFTLFVLIFFRDNPEELGMVPDGEKYHKQKHHVNVEAYKQFTLREAIKTFSFWVYVLPLAVFTLYVTAFTFHLISIFDSSGLDQEQALYVFIPVSFISVGFSFVGGWLSDRMRLKYLLMLMLSGELIALLSLAYLNDGIFYYSFILGYGTANGLFNVFMTVTWPRFYGRKHLGTITGFVTALGVFSSALGPLLFSFSYTRLGSYSYGFLFFSVIVIILLILSFKGNNPQDKFENKKSFD